jgi:hypothetical protein
MLAGVMLMWFLLTALSLLFVVIDIRTMPIHRVIKWGFILLTVYMGPFGAFLYVLGCREPLLGTHERYVARRWNQALGSTIHCVAGDGLGILLGAVISSQFHLTKAAEISLEYALGFGFGWSIFQALFMRSMGGGSYRRSLSGTFFPELLSMNCLMAGMVPVMSLAMAGSMTSRDPLAPPFWFIMSMSLLVGFITAYPMNWWLVSRHLKHGMITVRSASGIAKSELVTTMNDRDAQGEPSGGEPAMSNLEMRGGAKRVSTVVLTWVTILSVAVLGVGLFIAHAFGGL